MGFFGFGRKVDNMKADIKRIEHRDNMEAIVGAMVLVAWANGACEDSELQNILALIEADDNLNHFGNEINQALEKFSALMKAGPLVGKMKIKKEIKEIAKDPEVAEQVFLSAITIAGADGKFDKAEFKVLVELGKELGLSLAKYEIDESIIAE